MTILLDISVLKRYWFLLTKIISLSHFFNNIFNILNKFCMTQYFFLTENTLLCEKKSSTEEQITSLTKRVVQLSSHLKIHKKDYGSQRGLRKILGKRKRLLIYLLHTNAIRYDLLIKELGIRRPRIESN
jgi:small subunit ribosomal protein S15